MKINQRNPSTKEQTKQIGNTLFTIKSAESKNATQTIKAILKKRIEQHT